MPFYLTRPRTSALIRQLHTVLTDDEISSILRYLSAIETKDGQLGGGDSPRIDNEVRRSKIAWVPVNKETDWIYQKLSKVMRQVNYESYNFDLTLIQDVQYTEYHGTNAGTYHDHLDWAPMRFEARKLSMSIQLTDNHEYKGGDLEIKTSSEAPFVASRVKGDGVVFPSFLLHGVTPVTTGTRKSLVVWAQGPEFR